MAMTDPMADPKDTRRLVTWLRPAPTEVERAQRSEDYFWLRFVVLVTFFAAIGTAGILKVRHATIGVRTAYELVQMAEELRTVKEKNRSLQSQLQREKNPNELNNHSVPLDMHAPTGAETEDVE
jgi:hypothetical protein